MMLRRATIAALVAIASVAQPVDSPLSISRNAISVRKPTRVLLSMISIRHRGSIQFHPSSGSARRSSW